MARDDQGSDGERPRIILTVDEFLALDERLEPDSFRVVQGTPGDIPEIVRLITTRRMPQRLPLKFARTEALLVQSWPGVHWLLAKRGGRLVGCLELRPVTGEPDVWEIGSVSQARDCSNPRVPVKLWTAGLRALVDLGAREAVVEVHRDNVAAWRFLAHTPFEREGQSAEYPEFTRCRMRLRGAPGSRGPGS
jgi:ribosomal protein S18 acetylase RimI-like enzyme